MSTKTRVGCLLLAIGFALPARGETLGWIRQFGTDESDDVRGVSVDGQGNVYISGGTRGDLGAPNAGSYDAFVSKYDTSGVLQWTEQFGTSERDMAHSISADELGNIYVSGRSDTSGGDWYPFLAKYNTSGARQWTRQLDINAFASGYYVSADGLGNVYFSGSIWTDDGRDAFISKYDAGGSLEWTRQLDSGESDASSSVSADGLGSVYITGETSGDFGGSGDVFVAKYDASGTLRWTRQFGWTDNDTGWGVSADVLGNVYIAGVIGFMGPVDAYITKYDADGSYQWTHRLGSPNEYDWMGGVSADGLGNVYLAGTTDGGLGGPPLGEGDGFLAKFYDLHESNIDFSGDGNLDIADLNMLLAAGPVANGVDISPGQTEMFDLTGDGVIDMDDVSEWLSEAATANGFASPYKYGDANLDGTVDVADFNLWNTHKFSYSLAWDDGDFNGNGAVDVSDFLVWNNHKFTTSGVTGFAVPEPSPLLCLAAFVGVHLLLRQPTLHTRRQRNVLPKSSKSPFHQWASGPNS